MKLFPMVPMPHQNKIADLMRPEQKDKIHIGYEDDFLSGKTWTLMYIAAKYSMMMPLNILFITAGAPQFKEDIIDTFSFFMQGYVEKKHGSNHSCKFMCEETGSSLNFFNLTAENDVYKLAGRAYDIVLIDDTHLFRPKNVSYLLSLRRPSYIQMEATKENGLEKIPYTPKLMMTFRWSKEQESSSPTHKELRSNFKNICLRQSENSYYLVSRPATSNQFIM